MTFFDLPLLNACLNGTATLLLIVGWIMIRRKNQKAHVFCMVAALVVSTAFLGSYLFYHTNLPKYTGLPHVPFGNQGTLVAKVYYFILIPHVILAMINLPMIIATVIPAVRERFDRHRRIARWTLPVWLYVSVTGVLIYLMLYQWFGEPAMAKRNGQHSHLGTPPASVSPAASDAP